MYIGRRRWFVYRIERIRKDIADNLDEDYSFVLEITETIRKFPEDLRNEEILKTVMESGKNNFLKQE